jgi:Golgi nucleoside diphosphatase
MSSVIIFTWLLLFAVYFNRYIISESDTLVPLISSSSSIISSGYIILIDAGSSGSRIYIHQYKFYENQLLPLIEEAEVTKTQPGLSSYALDPLDCYKPIKKLMEFAKTKIPKDQWHKTAVHLQATAGLRSISSEQANAILEVIRNELETSEFLFERHWAKIISGEQEGLNGWITTNYLLGVFNNNNNNNNNNNPLSTYGVVEMGN